MKLADFKAALNVAFPVPMLRGIPNDEVRLMISQHLGIAVDEIQRLELEWKDELLCRVGACRAKANAILSGKSSKSQVQ